MLQHESWIVSGQVDRRFQCNVVKNERANDAVHGADTKLMKILSTETFGHSQQPLHVFAVRRIPSVFRLGSVVVHPTS